MVCRLGNPAADEPCRLRYSDDLKADEPSVHLPLIQCRECRGTGWGAVRRAFHAYLSRRAPRKLLTRTKGEEKSSSGCWQPLVRLHPDTGRKSLYLNPMRADAVEDMDRKDGDALLDRLYGHCDQARFQYSHRWRPGDVLIPDNRCALHQATFDFDQSRRRYLHRIMLRGERPVLAP